MIGNLEERAYLQFCARIDNELEHYAAKIAKRAFRAAVLACADQVTQEQVPALPSEALCESINPPLPSLPSAERAQHTELLERMMALGPDSSTWLNEKDVAALKAGAAALRAQIVEQEPKP